ncbi:MAG: tRNA dihydrouridine synthase [Promethearchaeota archaeon]
MKLGTLNIANRYILAPMQNVTTGPYRRFCRTFHEVGLVSVPMVYCKKIAKNPKFLDYELCKIEEERPISIQLIGSDKYSLKKSIDSLESYKFDILDINAGCPSRRAIKAKEGGYLMKDLDLLNVLVNTAVKNCSKPVSLKIRTGFDRPVNLDKVADIANSSGIDFLIIHARTVRSKYNDGTIDFETIKNLKQKLRIPLVGNGNITNPKIAEHFIDYTKVDALMIGRESMGNPQIFQQIHDYLSKKNFVPFKNHKVLMKKLLTIYEEIIDDFLSNIELPYGSEGFKSIELKRNSIWLTKDIENSTSIRTQLSKAKTLKQLKSILDNIFV